MKITLEQANDIKTKYKGYQVFSNQGKFGDSMYEDKDLPFVKVCYDYEYIEIYNKLDNDIKNFNKFFEWGKQI